jgi:hypothetical protein
LIQKNDWLIKRKNLNLGGFNCSEERSEITENSVEEKEKSIKEPGVEKFGKGKGKCQIN